MLSNQDFIVFSDDWGRHPFSCQHIIEKFLPHNRVLWINTIGYRSLKLSIYDLKRSKEKILGWIRNLNGNQKSSLSHNLIIADPICLPFGQNYAVRLFNGASIRRKTKELCRQYGFCNPILITTLPMASDYIGTFNVAFSVYYCVDDFTLWPGVDLELMKVLENKLLSKVDIVIATSERLAATRSNGRRQTLLLTHGVDVGHFRPARAAKSAKEVQDLKKPIVVYFGLIDERCDLPLLNTVISKMQDVTFLIIGSWRVNPGQLKLLPNVKIIGAVPYQDLPSYLSAASALILPYIVNELTMSINPLKLKEYLATGLPVVSTPMPEVLKLKRFVNIAQGSDEFITSLYQAINHREKNIPELNIFLEQESWEAKAEEFSMILEKSGLLKRCIS